MDITLSEGELMSIYNDFHHGQYAKVLDFDVSSVSDEAKQPAQITQYRAQIALGQADKVLAATKGSASTPAIAAVRALATFASGKTDAGVAEAEKLASAHAEDSYVQTLAGTVLAAGGKHEEAVALLAGANSSNSLEPVAVVVQAHLAANRVDLATREVAAARKWAQDSLLFNIADSWLGLRLGGERYQQAYYEFDEMPVPQAVAEVHLGRLPEAEAALLKHLEENEGDQHALANAVVLRTLAGQTKEAEEARERLGKVNKDHPLLADLKEKSDLFDQAASKFTAKVAS